ncbi:MAG: class I SAM-dependent methyltransferase [Alsobacter sp.]
MLQPGPGRGPSPGPLQEPDCTLLHVGCGPYQPDKLHPWFRGPRWREIRLDIDPRVRPDIVASLTDLGCFPDGSVDAVWSSHNIEHLHEHELEIALAEIVRVLKPTGFALFTTPDLVRVAQEIAAGRLEDTLYVSPAGPITPIDVLYGLRRSIAAGNGFMAHRTGFSVDRLGRVLVEAGFAEARVWPGRSFDLWAVGLREQSRPADHGIAVPGPSQGGPDAITG